MQNCHYRCSKVCTFDRFRLRFEWPLLCKNRAITIIGVRRSQNGPKNIAKDKKKSITLKIYHHTVINHLRSFQSKAKNMQAKWRVERRSPSKQVIFSIMNVVCMRQIFSYFSSSTMHRIVRGQLRCPEVATSTHRLSFCAQR